MTILSILCTCVGIAATCVAATVDPVAVVVLLVGAEPVEALPEEHVENVVGRGVVLEEHEIAAAVVPSTALLASKLRIVSDCLVVLTARVVVGLLLHVRQDSVRFADYFEGLSRTCNKKINQIKVIQTQFQSE